MLLPPRTQQDPSGLLRTPKDLLTTSDSLFALVAVQEAGPLEAGLLAAHPEDGGDPHHQHHQVLDEEEDQRWLVALLHLGGDTRGADCITQHCLTFTPSFTHSPPDRGVRPSGRRPAGQQQSG